MSGKGSWSAFMNSKEGNRRLEQCLRMGHLVNQENAGGQGVCCYCRRLLTPYDRLAVVADEHGLRQLISERKATP